MAADRSLVALPIKFSREEIRSIKSVAGELKPEEWAAAVLRDVVRDLGGVVQEETPRTPEPEPGPPLAAEEVSLAPVLAELRETKRTMLETMTWIQFLYAELCAHTSFQDEADRAKRTAKAASDLADVKRLIAARMQDQGGGE